MATTDARPVPRKNAAFRMYFAIRKNDTSLITSWAGQDSKVSLDGGSFADCTNEATEIGTSGCGYIDLTDAEMNADAVVLKVTVTNTDAVPLVFVFHPEEAGDYRVNSANSSVGSVSGSVGLVVAAVELDPAVGTQITNIENASGYLLAVLAGACADPQTASETYAITVFGSTFTVDMAGQTSTGTRTAPTLTKA